MRVRAAANTHPDSSTPRHTPNPDLAFNVNVRSGLFAFACHLASRLGLPLPPTCLARLFTGSSSLSQNKHFVKVLAAPSRRKCATLSLAITSYPLKALARLRLGKHCRQGKQTAVRGCWYSAQPGRLPTHTRAQAGGH